jgi:hypothetical protein
MIRSLVALLSFLAFMSNASAQQSVYRYDDNAIDSSVKCELGRASREYGPQKAGGPKMTATVTAKRTDTTSKKVAGSLFFGGATYEDGGARTSSFKATRNINVDNHINCRKSFVIDLGLYSCFMEKRARFFAGETISCGGSSSGSLDLSLGGSWTLGGTAKLQGDLIKKREWTVEVSAPAGKSGG